MALRTGIFAILFIGLELLDNFVCDIIFNASGVAVLFYLPLGGVSPLLSTFISFFIDAFVVSIVNKVPLINPDILINCLAGRAIPNISTVWTSDTPNSKIIENR